MLFRSLSALQVYFEQPLREPLPLAINHALRDLSKQAINDGATPIDTALRYYHWMLQQSAAKNQPLDELDYVGVLGRMFALRDRMKFYREHQEALLKVGEFSKDKVKQK